MKRIFYTVILLAFVISCNESETKSDKDLTSTLVADGQTDEELQKALDELEAEEKAILGSITTLKFDKIRHDYGNVKTDSENLCKFKVTNTGKNPLIIENVSASCGCTTPSKPENPIAPGESDFIDVGFHPKPGQLNEIIKTVTVTANTEPKISEISIRAFVK